MLVSAFEYIGQDNQAFVRTLHGIGDNLALKLSELGSQLYQSAPGSRLFLTSYEEGQSRLQQRS